MSIRKFLMAAGATTALIVPLAASAVSANACFFPRYPYVPDTHHLPAPSSAPCTTAAQPSAPASSTAAKPSATATVAPSATATTAPAPTTKPVAPTTAPVAPQTQGPVTITQTDDGVHLTITADAPNAKPKADTPKLMTVDTGVPAADSSDDFTIPLAAGGLAAACVAGVVLTRRRPQIAE